MTMTASQKPYSDRFRYVEVANFVPDLDRVIRFKYDGNPVMYDVAGIDKFRNKHDNVGVYTSIFRYESKSIESAHLGPLYFDLDADDLERSKRDAHRLVTHLSSIVKPDEIRLYFTGAKGFHVEVGEQTLGIDQNEELPRIYRLIAEDMQATLDLPSLDFSVYDARRMWRLVNSAHQKTMLYKVRLPLQALTQPTTVITTFASMPRNPFGISLDLNITGNEWYRGYVASYEEAAEQRAANLAARRSELFDKYGTDQLKPSSNALVNHVTKKAVKTIADAPSGQRNATLNRESFSLFVVVLRGELPLDDARETLRTAADSIGLEDGEIEATLRSAERAARRAYENGDTNA